MHLRRLTTLLLLLALIAPAAGLCLSANGGAMRMACCPPTCPDAPLQMRACCPSDGAQPAAAGLSLAPVLSPPAAACAIVPNSMAVRPPAPAKSSPIGSVPIRLLTGVLLI